MRTLYPKSTENAPIVTFAPNGAPVRAYRKQMNLRTKLYPYEIHFNTSESACEELSTAIRKRFEGRRTWARLQRR